jgi:uncharacterized protein YndB with AHSA1/START domain
VTSRVLVSLRVAAPPDRAFSAFVDDIGVWWRPNDLFRFTPRDHGVLGFEPELRGRFTETSRDGEVFEIGRITVWEPGVRLAFTWRQASFAPDQLTQVEVRFRPVGEETQVTVEHSGWETVPQEHVARHGFPDAVFLRRHAEWWRLLLAAMAPPLGEGEVLRTGFPRQR